VKVIIYMHTRDNYNIVRIKYVVIMLMFWQYLFLYSLTVINIINKIYY